MKNLKWFLLIIAISGFVSLFYFFYNRSSASVREERQLTNTPIPEKLETVEGQIVSDMPTVPLFPIRNVKKSTKHTMGEVVEYLTLMEVNVPLNTVISFYQQELTNNGWTIVSLPEPENRNATGDEYIEAKKDNLLFRINLERDGEDEPTEVAVDLFVNPQ